MRAAQPEPGLGDRAAGQRPRTRSAARSRTSTPRSATCRASSPTTARRSAPRRTSWPRSPQALVESLDDIKQTLHVAPTTFQNFINIYQPAQGALTGALAVNNFANPIAFLCGAIQAASRLGAEQSAKLCVQYLAPIVKNRQYNFPPLGVNLFVGARPGPTRSPTARTGCGRTTCRRGRRRPHRRRRPPRSRTEAPPAAAGRRSAAAERRRRLDRSRRRPARHDGAARRWLMSDHGWRRAASAWCSPWP